MLFLLFLGFHSRDEQMSEHVWEFSLQFIHDDGFIDSCTMLSPHSAVYCVKQMQLHASSVTQMVWLQSQP